jgi:hypothetical protein
MGGIYASLRQAQILILEILNCMSAVKIFAFLGLEPRLNIKNRFNWAGKIEHFSKVSHN